jgi:hypothetical protein
VKECLRPTKEVCFNIVTMKKQEAIQLLGGTVAAAAEAVGVTYQAVVQWPEELPRRIKDRVEAALYRKARAKAKTKQGA